MVVIVNAGFIAMDKVMLAVASRLSVTCTVKLNGLPVAVVGVPEITPVVALTESPPGKAPAAMDHV